MTHARLQYLMLGAIVAGYLLVATLYAVQTPAWQAPDEPAHYNTVRQIADEGCCAVIEMGDWDSELLDTLKRERFRPDLLDELATIEYEDHQPPLYYALLAVVYRASAGSLVALRMVSVVLGVGIVLSAYGVARLLLPKRPTVALGAAALVAFIPQHAAILGSVNNDALANLWVALGFLLMAAYLNHPRRLTLSQGIRRTYAGVLVGLSVVMWFTAGAGLAVGVWMAAALFTLATGMITKQTAAADGWHLMLGTVLGLIFITKTTGYFMLAVLPLAIVLRPVVLAAKRPEARGAGVAMRVAGALGKLPLPPMPFTAAAEPAEPAQGPNKGFGRRFAWEMLKNAREVYAPAVQRAMRTIRRGVLLMLAVALGLGALWWMRNVSVYGGTDILGLSAHDVVVVGQLRTSERIAQVGWGGYWRGALTTTFNSFWGQLGWMALPLPNGVYARIGFLLVLSATGLAFDVRRTRQRELQLPTTAQVVLAGLMGWAALLVVLQVVYYNLSFYQVQGRYLFPALIPFAIVVAAGLDGWMRELALRLEWRAPQVAAWVGYAMPLALAGAFGGLNLWLIRFVLPYLAY